MGSAAATSDGHQPDGSLFHVGANVSLASVLVFLSLLVVVVAALEQLLHRLEQRAGKSRKHEEMVRKAYRELMILGFLGIGIKVYKEATHVSPYSTAILAFQVADLTIFILAISLIFQASCVFLLLRRENVELDRAELVCASDLASVLQRRQQLQHEQRSRRNGWRWLRRMCSRHRDDHEATTTDTTATIADDTNQTLLDDLVQLRVLRHLFLRKYHLPELFPFSKYLRQAQDNQITHMIDVEISMWLLLLCVAWGIDGVIISLRRVGGSDSEPRALVLVFLVFSWALVALHIAVATYFHRCVQQLLAAAGYRHGSDAIACLTAIGESENATLLDEMAGDALEVMHEVQDRQEARRRIAKGKFHQHQHANSLRHDKGFQLLAMAVRHLCRRCRRCFALRAPAKAAATASSIDTTTATMTEITTNTSVDLSDGITITVSETTPGTLPASPSHRRRSATLTVNLRWFSRKAWHFVVMVLLMLNGFYVALLCQCVLYQLGTLAHHSPAMQAMIIIALPLPVVLNMLAIQPKILRNFLIVSSIQRVDVDTLSEVVNHFSEIVELRADFLQSLLVCMRTASVTIEQLQVALEAKDRRRTGTIEVEELRLVLRAVGFRLSHFRFNSVAKLLFRLRDTRVEYAQVLRMLSLEQEISCAAPASETTQHEYHHALLRQTELPDEDEDVSTQWRIHPGSTAAATDFAVVGATDTATDQHNPPVARDRMASSGAKDTGSQEQPTLRPMLSRRQSGFQNTSSWALRALYHIDSMRAMDTAAMAAASTASDHGQRSRSASSGDQASTPRETNYVQM